MQAPPATSAAQSFQAFVNFLVSIGMEEPAAIAVAGKNDEHARLLSDLFSIRFLEGVPDEELPAFIAEYLGLPQALEGEQLELTKNKLAKSFLCMRAVMSAGMSAGKKSRAVQYFRSKMLECAREYCSNRETLALDDSVLMCQVTFCRLIDAKGTPAGVMAVFPDGLRQRILGAIPKAPALLERVLAEAASAAAQIAAPSRKRVRVLEVLEEPELLCDENIADLDRECKVDSTHETTVSAEQASGDEASAEDESGFTTPKPKGMSKRDIELINRAPLKMPRQGQD
jgi:hypothetical protein